MITFQKKPGESYGVAVDFTSKLATGRSLASGTASATQAGVDATAAVLVSTVVTIAGALATVTVQNGTAGDEYTITLSMLLDNGDPLTEQLLLQVIAPVVGPTLQQYLTKTRRILHDAGAIYWQDDELIDYINEGRQQVAARCKQVRLLQTLTLTVGIRVYDYSLLGVAPLDVLGIVVIWGNTRVQLRQKSYTWLTTFGQPWTTYTDVPRIMARYGASQIYLAPTPSQALVTEWDTAVLPQPMNDLADADASMFPYSEPVPYYAAKLAKENQQQWDEADRFEKLFLGRIADCPAMGMERLIENMYDDEDG